ncbi:hypothetical protein Tco_1182658 [Tanacetum coccineum]
MTTLKFADTHNMVAFFAKPAESEGFEQIVDFLNAHPIKYVDGKKIIITESTVRRDLQLEDAEGVDCVPNATIFKQLTLIGPKTTAWSELSSTMASAIICLATNQKFNFSKLIFENNVADKDVYKDLDDNLVRAATTASSLEAEQDSGNIIKTRSKATLNEPSSSGTSSGSGPRGNTLQSGEDRLKLEELMALCTTLQSRVLALETTKTTQANEIAGDEEDLGEDASKQGRRIHDIDADEDITLVNDDNEMFDVGTLTGDEVLAEQVVAAKDVNLSVDEVTLAQALTALKSAKVREKGDVIKEQSVLVSVVSASTKDSAATTITATIPTPRKGIVFQEPAERTNQVDEEFASKLQAEFDEEVRLAREKVEKEQEANVALTEEWDDIQAKIEADHELAQRLQAQEQEQLSDAEKATLFVQLLEKRRKHFTAMRAKEMRNKPSTKAQKRNTMSTYLKNMAGYKHNQLKNKSFDDIQKLFEKSMKRVNTFVDMDTELVKGSEKRTGEELMQESAKK